MPAWLFTVDEPVGRLNVGQSWRLWTKPPLNASTGGIRRRADGEPYTPAWTAGEEIIIYEAREDRCVAAACLDSGADWNERKRRFYTETTILAYNPNGPRLRDIGLKKALQGGRHRLTAAQHGAARKRLPRAR